jgi:hypothetical protein
MTDEVTPLIYTINGNVPVADLRYEVLWEDTEECVKLTENYYLGDDLVRSGSHVLTKAPAPMFGIQAEL